MRKLPGGAYARKRISRSREFAALLAQHGWPVHLEEVPTDHAGVIMAQYDPQTRRGRPATGREAIEGGKLPARVIRATAAGTNTS
jgi:hypothetical protein